MPISERPCTCFFFGLPCLFHDSPNADITSRVSKLMKRICNPEEALDDSLISDVCVSDERKEEVKAAIAEWHFCAHDFTDDELCYASCLMFEHTLTMPELEHWRISPGTSLFLTCTRPSHDIYIITNLVQRLYGNLYSPVARHTILSYSITTFATLLTSSSRPSTSSCAWAQSLHSPREANVAPLGQGCHVS